MRPVRARALLLASLPALLASCGGGGSSPTSPSGPSSSPQTPGVGVSGYVYYDENGSGSCEPEEVVRLPGVTVEVGGRTARTEAGGLFTATGVPTGSVQARLRSDGAPPFFQPGAAVTVQVGSAGASGVAVGATLPIGTNRANRYLAFGDSITSGDGSSDESGYRGWLEADLRSHWGRATLTADGQPGTRSDDGAARIGVTLMRERPAYVVILYGTNDWNRPECKDERFPCFTIDSLRSMVDQAQAFSILPVVGTIPPVNPLYVDREAAERNEWVKRMNEQIRAMARQEGALLAETHAAMSAETDLASLFSDHVHPNDRGYQLLAGAFFRAITTVPASGSSAGTALLTGPPGR